MLEGALAGSSSEVELSALGVRQRAARFANSQVTQTSDVEQVMVQARVAEGGRVGWARSRGLSGGVIEELLARARAAAAAYPPDPAFVGFDDGRVPTPAAASSHDPAVSTAKMGELVAGLAPVLHAGSRAGFSAAGLAAAGELCQAVATTAGCRRSWSTTRVRLDVIVSNHDASGYAAEHGWALTAIDAAKLAEIACDKAARASNPVELAPGSYDVVLEPAALAEVLGWLALTGLGARSVEEGTSCLAERMGQSITGDITLYDDGLAGEDGCPTAPFDAEGTARQRLVLVERGIARGVAHDRASAARVGQASTGHAPLLDDGEFGPVPQLLHLQAGSDEISDLLARVERGLWVTRFHYVNGLVDPRRALMTGMTRDGTFLIEGGRPARAVRNLRWNESLLDAFTRLGGMTQTRRVVSSSFAGTTVVCPTVLVRGWHFSG